MALISVIAKALLSLLGLLATLRMGTGMLFGTRCTAAHALTSHACERRASQLSPQQPRSSLPGVYAWHVTNKLERPVYEVIRQLSDGVELRRYKCALHAHLVQPARSKGAAEQSTARLLCAAPKQACRLRARAARLQLFATGFWAARLGLLSSAPPRK